jgi:hypothetical protein
MTDQVVARFYFLPDRANEFLFEEDQLVSEVLLDTTEEALEYAMEFSDALENASFLINGSVIELVDFLIKDAE